MDAQVKDQLIERNEAEYAPLTWITPQQAARAAEERAALLERLRGLDICRGTKPHCGELSPGCRACVEGTWSCLFINGKCNGRCFYCPTSQDEIGLPTTNTLTFESPEEYADYVNTFGFKGVSFSGGEPLLTFERTLAFLKAVKQDCCVHTWLYTNGILLTAEKVKLLKDAGLDEIRFDIGATGYSLKAAALAVGQIPTVTVEIPAVPEEHELLRAQMAEMRALGVAHLNLHQLRLTPHNYPHLSIRPYTFLHGERVTVLESELTALRLVAHGAELGLPVNYCSFVYKHRFQRQAALRRNAAFIRKPHETITASGHLRGLALVGEDPGTGKIWLGPEELKQLDRQGCTLRVEYGEVFLRPALSYRHPFREIRLASGRKLFVEKQQRIFDLNERAAIDSLIAGNAPQALLPFEELEPGLQCYF